ncbi:hypothetical protein PsYK624_034600 [Phanerochaete sordida]|uniref:Prolyl 4-hydroxylase alpha subunit Fe(2+) 2OG dioxygenase domain-containing protein n=1 Tax=Phanerochaete sordida TaxID=48140 RepID=A0A9P3G3E6_9APHY|nr:hypothetical protein PsYK624_034600 [Phanerochaete sordida]
MASVTQASSAVDVRSAFEAALKETKSNFQAAFSFHRTYPEAPNPALKLSDLGIVGLPLSTREAESIKAHSAQAPFGMGERTLVDKTVRDTWEMDGKKVSFVNPKWDTWLAGVVGEVCRTLGVNVAASRPRAELYKLLLYETGSHFLPHLDTEKADGMFATIIIVLPSHFTGGAAHLSFGELSTVYDCSPKSQLETSVMAWYTDVTHEIKPITSGHRLALSYNLLHTTSSLRPALHPQNSVAEKLRRVLRAWRADTSARAPHKLLVLLDHKYAEANLGAAALKGADAQRAAVLDALARAHGFRLGLANAHCHLSGPADDCGGGGWGGGWGGRRYGRYDDYGGDDDVDFVEIESRVMTVQHFVDLDGELISKKLEYNKNGETIPADLTDSIESGPHDKQEYEGYMGNWAGTLERWYRRTVLVIWPARNNYTVLYDAETGFARALEDLHADNAPEAERELVEFVLTHRARGPGAAAEAVCLSALHADDAPRWQRAVALCAAQDGAGVAVVDAEVWREAGERWGWDVLKPSFEVMLAHDGGNQSRLEFLGALQEAWEPVDSDEDTVAALHAQLQPWAAAQVPGVLRTLRVPVVDDVPALLAAASECGGIACLKDVILPQLLSLAPEDVLRELATQLFAADAFPDSPEKSEVISALLRAGIAKAPFFVPTLPKPPVPFGRAYQRAPPSPPPPATDRAALAKRYVQTCVVLGCADLVGAVLARVGDTSTLDAAQARECARAVMTPVVAACAQRMRGAPGSVPAEEFAVLREKAVRLVFEAFAENAAHVTRADVAALIGATLVDGDATTFVTSVAPRLYKIKWTEASFRALIDELHAQRARFVFPAGYTGHTFDALFERYVRSFTVAFLPPSAAAATATLDWLRAFGPPALWQRALAHFVDPPNATAQYAKNVLVPLAPALRQWARTHGLPDALDGAFAGLAQTWLRRVLEPAPPPDAALAAQLAKLASWGCACAHCAGVQRFLAHDAARTRDLPRIGAPARRHVEGHLAAFRALAGCETVRTTPQTLRVTKTAALHALVTWRTEQVNGRALLKSIAPDDAELRTLLGEAYAGIVAALNGTVAPPARAAPSAQASTDAVASGAGASHLALPPAPPGMVQAAAPAASGGRPAVGGEPPAKRRKYIPTNEDDIIDLT